jgi:hypothetical protein
MGIDRREMGHRVHRYLTGPGNRPASWRSIGYLIAAFVPLVLLLRFAAGLRPQVAGLASVVGSIFLVTVIESAFRRR